MREEELNQMKSAMDQMFDLLTSEDGLGFSNESERLGFFFRRLKQRDRSWRRSKPCMYPGCQKLSIVASHTIPRSGPLALLAEDGHVITPHFYKGQVRAELVGIGEASVFPGFCQEHERLFERFEQSKCLADATDITLQALRVVCRESRIKQEQSRFTQQLLDEHQQLVNTRGMTILRQLLGDAFMAAHPIKEIAIGIGKLDPLIEKAHEQIKEANAVILQYENDFLGPLMEASQGKDSNVSGIRLTIPQHQLPACLAGRGNFRFKAENSEQIQEVVAILNVWPTETDTSLLMVVREQDQAAAETYFARFSQPEFNSVSMVESWMVHGSDHWFMRPSAWNVIPEVRQRKILHDMLDTTFNIGNEYRGSLFDDIRRQVIAANEDGERPAVKEWLEGERRKLSYPEQA